MTKARTVRSGWSPFGGRRADERREAAEREARMSLAALGIVDPKPEPDATETGGPTKVGGTEHGHPMKAYGTEQGRADAAS